MGHRAAATVTAILILGLGATAGPAAAAPKPGVFAGSLGVPVPAGATAEIRAVNRATGRLVAARTVNRTGRFTLTLPPGGYFVVGTVVPRRGAARPATIGIGVSLKAGQRRLRTNLRAKKRARAVRRPARESFRQERGQVTPGSVAVQMPYFTGATGEAAVLNRGLADLLTTDITNNDCGVAVREVNRIGDILKELEFQRSPYVDPSTRLQRNFIVADVEVRGTLSTRRAPLPVGVRVGYKLDVVDLRSGEVLSTLEGALDGNRLFEDADRLGKTLTKELCELTDVYEVSLDVQGILRAATHDASGTLRATLRARRGTEGGGAVWRDSGALVWSDLGFASKVGCPIVDPIPGTSPWSVTIIDSGGRLVVTWTTEDVGAAANSTATIDCPPEGNPPTDPPPIPGLPGPSLLDTGPTSFTLPYAGGKQPLRGEISIGGDGFFNSGTITVTPAGTAKRR